jgi:hypothetical protein
MPNSGETTDCMIHGRQPCRTRHCPFSNSTYSLVFSAPSKGQLQMCGAIKACVHLTHTAPDVSQGFLALTQLETLQDMKHSSVSTLQRPDKPCMVRTCSFSDDMKIRIRCRPCQMRIEAAKLARSEEGKSPRCTMISAPIVCVMLYVRVLNSS